MLSSSRSEWKPFEELARSFAAKVLAGDLLVAFPSYTHPAHQGYLPEYERSNRGYSLAGPVDLVALGGLARRAIVPARTGPKQQCAFFPIDLDHRGAGRSSGGARFPCCTPACPSRPALQMCASPRHAGPLGGSVPARKIDLVRKIAGI